MREAWNRLEPDFMDWHFFVGLLLGMFLMDIKYAIRSWRRRAA